MNKVLVTGAGGFIGSNLVEELIKSGITVKAFIHYNSSNSWGNLEFLPEDIKKEIEVISGNIQDPFSVNNAVKGQDTVFHLAALIGIPYSYKAPNSYVNTNVIGTLNILQACLDNNIEKIVHTSTSETYGTAIYTPIDEKHPLKAQSPYSASKIGADKLAESYHLSFGLPIAIIRPFNTFGPRQSARAIIPTIISQILSGSKVVIGSIDPVRDFTFVKDTVNGFIKIATEQKSAGELINIGSGKGISIGELAHKIIQMINPETEIIIDTKRIRPDKSEVMKLICDNTKAREILNWKPNFSLEDGIKETISYIKNHLEFYKLIYNV